jgi:hypothetical protein
VGEREGIKKDEPTSSVTNPNVDKLSHNVIKYRRLNVRKLADEINMNRERNWSVFELVHKIVEKYLGDTGYEKEMFILLRKYYNRQQSLSSPCITQKQNVKTHIETGRHNRRKTQYQNREFYKCFLLIKLAIRTCDMNFRLSI